MVVTAHSGCEHTPPNSREHVAAALRAGADVVEVDVRLARGRLVLVHGPLEKLSGSVLALAEAWELIATEHPAAPLWNLDVKERAALPALAAFLPPNARAVITGCQAPWVSLWRQLRTDVPVLYNVQGVVRPGVVADAIRRGAAGLNADYRLLTAALVAEARQAGLTVEAWTVDTASDQLRLAAWGITGLTTHFPAAAHRVLTPS